MEEDLLSLIQLPLLAQLLNYKNEKLIHYYCYHHPEINEDQAEHLFQDLLGWMWLNRYRQANNRQTHLFGPLLRLDEIWHSFILHTQDYFSFCLHYFGDYFHHHIEPPGFEHELSEEELADFLSDCFDYLGEDWINRQFLLVE